MDVLRTAVGTTDLLDCVSCPVTETIGAAGGTVEIPGEARLIIPAGALSTDTAITLEGTAPALLSQGLAPLDSDFSYSISPAGLALAVPATIEVDFDPIPTPPSTSASATSRGVDRQHVTIDLLFGCTDAGGESPGCNTFADQTQTVDADSGANIFSGTFETLVPFVVSKIAANSEENFIFSRIDFVDEQAINEAIVRDVGVACSESSLSDAVVLNVTDTPSSPNLANDNTGSFDIAPTCSGNATFTNTCAEVGMEVFGADFVFAEAAMATLYFSPLANSTVEIFNRGFKLLLSYAVTCLPEALPTFIVLDLPIVGPEGIQPILPPFGRFEDAGPFGGGPGIIVAGGNGAVIGSPVDDGFGGITVLSREFIDSFSPGTRSEAVGLNDPVNGRDVYFEVSNFGFATTVFEPEFNEFSGFFTVDPGSNNFTDVRPTGNDPTGGEALATNFQGNEVLSIQPRATFGAAINDRINASALAGLDGHVISVYGETIDGPILGVTVGNEIDVPGNLFIHHGGPNDMATDLGDVGLSPRRIRCTNPMALGGCIVPNFGDDTMTAVTSDDGFGGGFTLTNIDIGDGPIGGDVVLLSDGEGSGAGESPTAVFRAVTTGFFDNTFTVTDMAADGSVVDQDTFDAPDTCLAPGHAMWLSTNQFAATCNGSDNLVVATLP
ncbi:MAG: hypothetical protein ACI91F_002326 [Candidatus Binatia bacterium]